jgi:hypothetical protein
MALTSKLTNIADAIRDKTGDSAKLTLDGMVAAIAGLETGGEGMKVATGEFTPSESIDFPRFVFEHNAGFTPSFFYISQNGTSFNSALRSMRYSKDLDSFEVVYSGQYGAGSSNATYEVKSAALTSKPDESTITFPAIFDVVIAPTSYRWIAVGLDEA